VPFAGAKGYRTFDNWSLQNSNLALWVSQDTVLIEGWAATGADEHNTIRRGIVAFGAVSDPAAVPAAGSASYAGPVYGWYAGNGTADPVPFRGTGTVTVDFATRQAVVAIRDTVTNDAASAAVPVVFAAEAGTGAAGGNVANYLTGPVDNGTLKGGLSGRYFGPVIATGASGAGPAEVAGAFSLSNATTGAAAIGGFIGRKQ
jgi:hypothetical protein